MRKTPITTITILTLLLINSVNALDWHEQKEITQEMGRKLDYDGSFGFKYYQNNKNYLAYYHTNTGNYKNSTIIFYQYSLELPEEQFRCVVLHELGHYDEVRFRRSKGILNESYANEYAFKKMKACYGWLA